MIPASPIVCTIHDTDIRALFWVQDALLGRIIAVIRLQPAKQAFHGKERYYHLSINVHRGDRTIYPIGSFFRGIILICHTKGEEGMNLGDNQAIVF